MTEPLERDEIIGLLERLGSERDEDVLEAARQVHDRISAAGVSWADLLIPEEASDESAGAEDAEEFGEIPEPEDQDLEAEGAVPPVDAAKANVESMAQIERLLAKSGISDEMREELESYKTDIADGSFEEGDRRYLRALSERLSKRS